MRLTPMLGAALALTAAACSDSGSGPGGGTQILLTDDPFPYHMVARVDVHFVRLEATTTLDTVPDAPDWVTIATPARTVNLLELQSGVTTLLGEVDLPAGEYKAIRVTIDSRLSSITSTSGADVPVQWGVDGEITMYAFVEDPLPVSPAGARIILDFDVGRSFQAFGDGFVFLPWIRAVNEAATGAITGTVTFGVPLAVMENAVVSAYRGGPEGQGGWLAATARTDAQGRYTLAFLTRDAYWLVLEPPLNIEGQRGPCVRTDSILVVEGALRTVDAELPSLGAPCGGGGGPDTTGTDTTITDTTTTPGGPVATVTVTINPPQVSVGDSVWAIANLADAAGVALYGRAVTWSVSDTTVARVDGIYGQYLNFRAVRAGAVTFTATSEGKTGSATVTVQ